MSYRIKPRERSGKAVERIVRQQLRRAVGQARQTTRPLDDRVHDVRSRLKRTRAALRLVSRKVGAPARTADRWMRDLARRLSEARDLAVEAETLHRLLERNPESVAAAADQSLRDIGTRLRARMRALNVEARLRGVADALAAGARDLGRWRVPHGRRAVRQGFEASYRKARRRLRQVEQHRATVEGDARAERLHAWRKAIKRLGHQVAILRRQAPALARSLRAPLTQLGELLGEAHDLAALRLTLERELSAPRDQRNRGILLDLIDARARLVEGQAEGLGRQTLAARPREIRRLLR